MRLRVWGETDADVRHAEFKAADRPSRRGWEFTDVERLGGVPCPIDVRDPGAVAADRGYGWAYAVYPAGARVAP